MDKHIKALGTLRQIVELATIDYIRTTPLCTYQVGSHSISLDIRDLLLIGAMTESDVLLTGKTGSGKTWLANGVMKGLFGCEGYYAKTTLPSMNPSEFMDIDFPAILKGRKTLREAVTGIPALIRPGIVLNEVNRAPSAIQSLLIAFLDRELEVQGVPVEMGRPWSGGRYQFRIITINEGDSYKVQDLDPAIRDRMTIEVPVDAFPQTKVDVFTMLERSTLQVDENKGSSREANSTELEDHFDLVIQLRQGVEAVPVHQRASFFLNYLSGLSYCIRAPRGNKESIALSPEVCDGCHHMAAFYNLCGNIMAPSTRTLLRLHRVAKAFALFRGWRTRQLEDLMVVPEDIIEAAPFVLYSKLSLNPLWVRTAGNRTQAFWGDKWTAIREILAWIYRERFLKLVQDDADLGALIYRVSRGGNLRREDWERVYRYLIEKDTWAFDPAMVRSVLGLKRDMMHGMTGRRLTVRVRSNSVTG